LNRPHDLNRKTARKAALSIAAAFLLLFALGSASAQLQTTPNESPFDKQLDKLDLGIIGVGEYNTTVQGPALAKYSFDYGQTVTQYGSNTFGALVDLRYIAKPYVGLEFNYGYARYTENFNVNPLQIQTKVTEYSIGYVVTPPHTIFGLQPFASAGAGSLEFTPTPFGGQGAPVQARMVYYYSVGVQQDYEEGHFGLRAGFRQAFFLDPDFEENYLTILKHASTYQPMVGFYFRY
jgi:hypothetical protein